VLTGTVRRSSRRSLIDRCAVTGLVPCSGAERRDKVLDVVSTAIHGGAAAVKCDRHGHKLVGESPATALKGGNV